MTNTLIHDSIFIIFRRSFHSFHRMSHTATATTAAVTHAALPANNPYFSLSGKDVWSLINETAAKVVAETGKPVANLGQGFFSYSPPAFAIEDAKMAFDDAMTNQYAPAGGKPQLLQALASHYTKKLGRPVGTDQIVATTGANEGIFACLFGFCQQGDEVIVFQPFFDQYIPNIEMTGAKVVYTQLYPPEDFDKRVVDANEWSVDWNELESLITPKTKAIIINTPHNPIGKVFSTQELKRIGQLAVKHNFLIISDQVYENLYYCNSFPRMDKLEIEDEQLAHDIALRTLSIGSAGKTFAATGWRVGWVTGSRELIPYVVAAHTRICFSSPAPLQIAVAKAFEYADQRGSAHDATHPELNYFEKMRLDYVHKYTILENVLQELGLPYTKAEGAYYLLVNMKRVQMPELDWPELIAHKPRDYKLAYWLIREIGVVTIPPSVFYLQSGIEQNLRGSEITDCVRLAVCKDNAILHDAANRLRNLAAFIH